MKAVFADEAIAQLDALLDYLEREWSPKVRDKFVKKLQEFVSIIERYPEVFPVSNHLLADESRRCVVVPQVSLYYLIDIQNQRIIILTIRDNRMDYPSN